MPLIIWDNALSVGNAEIDAQHKQWVAILNELHDVMIQVNTKDINQAKRDSLKAMLDYSRYHFAFEEEYMAKINYPLVVEHWRLHRDFDSKLYEHYRAVNEGRLVLSSEIVTMLKEWLLNHIAVEDKKYQVSSSLTLLGLGVTHEPIP